MNKLQRLLSTGLVLLMVAACSPATPAVPTTAPTAAPTSAPVATQVVAQPTTAPTQAPAQPTTAPTSAATAANQAGVQLVFLTFETPVLTADFWDSNIATAQKALPPNVTIKRIVSPGIDRTTYAKQLLASNQFPDILQSINTQEFVDAGLLQTWDPKFIEANFIIPYGNALGGKVYQAPTNAQIIPFVFYNKDIFDKVGVKPPTTWTEFLAVAAKVKAAGYKPILACGSTDAWCTDIGASGVVSSQLLGDTPDWVAQRKAGKVHFTDANMVAVMTKYKQLVDLGYISPDDLGVNYATANQTFLDGQVAMYPMGSWFLQQAAKGAKFNVGVFLMPRDDGKIIVPFNVGGGTHVSAKSPHADLAMQFAQAFALNPDTLKALMESDSAFPLLKGKTVDDYHASVSDLFKAGYAYVGMQGAAQVDAFAWVNNDSALIAGQTDEFGKTIQNLILGGDVQTEMKRLDAAWDAAAKK
jgi:ABC-type glycerol-3-phosphate transport system substrate-binding protein